MFGKEKYLAENALHMSHDSSFIGISWNSSPVCEVGTCMVPTVTIVTCRQFPGQSTTDSGNLHQVEPRQLPLAMMHAAGF